MKQKDLILIGLTAVILLGGGYLAYTQLFAPKSAGGSNAGTPVEVIGSIPNSLDAKGVATLADPTKTIDFMPQYDLKTGLGNPTFFAQ
jgi:hypothetical protein